MRVQARLQRLERTAERRMPGEVSIDQVLHMDQRTAELGRGFVVRSIIRLRELGVFLSDDRREMALQMAFLAQHDAEMIPLMNEFRARIEEVRQETRRQGLRRLTSGRA